ncbi:MAG TPA: hypothetical protein VMT20_16270 [Terriglobia bacterium]|nr:hypothetical protein [Terriglobia bacterium]
MDVEKTMQFILDREAAFAAHLEAERAERLDADRKLNARLDTLTSAAASLLLSAQAHQSSMEELRAQWRDFLDRFDRYLRGRGGNGKK